MIQGTAVRFDKTSQDKSRQVKTRHQDESDTEKLRRCDSQAKKGTRHLNLAEIMLGVTVYTTGILLARQKVKTKQDKVREKSQ